MPSRISSCRASPQGSPYLLLASAGSVAASVWCAAHILLSRRSWRKKRPPRSSAAETVGDDKRRPDELLDQVRQRQTEAHRDDKRQPERTGEEDQSDGPVHRECAANVSSLTPRR
jgi:hypothetical protein